MNSHIPNLISITRLLSCALFFIIGSNKVLFSIILTLLIGLSDFFDGYVARKYKIQSIRGAKLDTIADMVYFISVFVYFCIYKTNLIMQYTYILIITIVCKLLPLIISLIKNRKIISIHTIMNKISGCMVIVGIIVIILFDATVMVKIISCIVISASIEESFILLLTTNPDVNAKSIFCIKNAED